MRKPTAEERKALSTRRERKDGVTAYLVTLAVNAWLKEDGVILVNKKGQEVTEVPSQRVYTQFTKKGALHDAGLTEEEIIPQGNGTPRFTNAGAEKLARYVFAYLLANEAKEATK